MPDLIRAALASSVVNVRENIVRDVYIDVVFPLRRGSIRVGDNQQDERVRRRTSCDLRKAIWKECGALYQKERFARCSVRDNGGLNLHCSLGSDIYPLNKAQRTSLWRKTYSTIRILSGQESFHSTTFIVRNIIQPVMNERQRKNVVGDNDNIDCMCISRLCLALVSDTQNPSGGNST